MVIGHTLHGLGPRGVIVLHGWMGDYSVFRPMFDFLDTDTFTYAFVDYRGYGESRDIAGDYTMAEIAADAIALADHLGWQDFHLIGHSMGGMAVQRVALDATDRVRSVVALTPVPASGVTFDDETWALFEGAIDQPENRTAVTDFGTGGRLTQRWLDMMTRNSLANSTVEAFRGYLTAWAKTDFAAEADGLVTPFLVVIGEHDGPLQADFMRETFLKWYPNARLETIVNAGHYPMYETPVVLATMMESYMKEHL